MSLNKWTRAGLAAGGALAGSMAALVFLVAPGKRDLKQRAPFVGHNFAHRGLHRIDKSTPENSAAAFEHASRIGYGSELDVHLTADGELVVFHDDDTREKVATSLVHINERHDAELKSA